MKNRILVSAACAATLLLGGCLSDSGSGEVALSDLPKPAVGGDQQLYRATLRRTSFGIPHITADDYASMGYAYGYAQAEDNLCLLAEDTLTIRGLRSRYLGPDGTFTIPANGATTTNLNADFFWRFVATDEAIAPFRSASDPEVIDASAGYVAGYNRYLAEIRDGKHPGRHQACRDADWLLALEEADMYRRYFRLAVLASSSVFVDGIATAAPPAGLDEVLPAAETLLQQLADAGVGGSGDLAFPSVASCRLAATCTACPPGPAAMVNRCCSATPIFPGRKPNDFTWRT